MRPRIFDCATLITAAVTVFFGAAVVAKAADRAPTAEEKSAVEGVLKTAGFKSWKKIELDDDGRWEVDDAIAADGKQYDVDIDAKTMKIVHQELETAK